MTSERERGKGRWLGGRTRGLLHTGEGMDSPVRTGVRRLAKDSVITSIRTSHFLSPTVGYSHDKYKYSRHVAVREIRSQSPVLLPISPLRRPHVVSGHPGRTKSIVQHLVRDVYQRGHEGLRARRDNRRYGRIDAQRVQTNLCL